MKSVKRWGLIVPIIALILVIIVLMVYFSFFKDKDTNTNYANITYYEYKENYVDIGVVRKFITEDEYLEYIGMSPDYFDNMELKKNNHQCNISKCDDLVSNYKLNSIIVDSEKIIGFIFKGTNGKHSIYSPTDRKIYEINGYQTVRELNRDTIVSDNVKNVTLENNLLIGIKEGKQEIFNYKNQNVLTTINHTKYYIEGFNNIKVDNNIYYELNEGPDPDVEAIAIVDKDFKLVTLNDKVIEDYEIKNNEIHVLYEEDNKYYIYDKNGNLSSNSEKPNILISNDGYYVSVIDNKTYLLTLNDEKLVKLCDGKLDGINNMYKYGDVIYINVRYSPNSSGCDAEEGQFCGKYKYDLKNKKLIIEDARDY